jgi:hypothetical protein
VRRAAGAPALARAAFALGYLVLWWVIASAASRRHGGAVFALGVLLLWPARHAYRRGRHAPLLWLAYGSLLAAACAVLLEAALHVRPQLLGGRVANFAYGGYHPYRGGIYSLDAHVGQLMRGNVRRWMYWNGHWWWHASNAQGWRGPSLDRADAVFLGDSMIYGHGVDAADTVPARLAARTALRTANLGQQGTCAPQQLMLFRRRGRALAPRVVLLCVHLTDFEDVARQYDASEQRRFLERPAEDPLIRPEYGPQPPWDPLWLWARYVELPLRGGGILGSLARVLREGRTQEGAAARDPFVPTAAEQEEVLPALRADAAARDALARAVHEAALRELKRECDGLGARLVLFDLGYPRGLREATATLAGQIGAEYSGAGGEALRRALAGEPVYLANDGHWTGRGAAIVADALSAAAAVRAAQQANLGGLGGEAAKRREVPSAPRRDDSRSAEHNMRD